MAHSSGLRPIDNKAPGGPPNTFETKGRRDLKKLAILAWLAAPAIALAAPAQDIGGTLEQRLNKLAASINLDKFERAIQSGDQGAFSELPARGYQNGFADVLKKYNLIVNPRHSFTQCSGHQKAAVGGGSAPGCVVSLKLARKSRDGSLQDTGIRTEWAKGFDDKVFVPNNSVWATHVTTGNGLFENSVSQ